MISINKSQCSFIEFFQLSGCALAAEVPCFCAVIEVWYNERLVQLHTRLERQHFLHPSQYSHLLTYSTTDLCLYSKACLKLTTAITSKLILHSDQVGNYSVLPKFISGRSAFIKPKATSSWKVK